MARKIIISVMMVMMSAVAFGQAATKSKTTAKSAAAAQPIVMNLDNMKWGPAPPDLPPGAASRPHPVAP